MDATVWNWVLIVAGVALALVGRRLFWLAVALAGFFLGWWLVNLFLPTPNYGLSLAVGVIAGVVGALIATRSLPLIGAAAGAILMGLVGAVLVDAFSDSQILIWLGFAAGAVIGWFLVDKLFEVGIAVVSALGGGMMVTAGLMKPDGLTSWEPAVCIVIGLAVAVAGLVVQRPNRTGADAKAAARG